MHHLASTQQRRPVASTETASLQASLQQALRLLRTDVSTCDGEGHALGWDDVECCGSMKMLLPQLPPQYCLTVLSPPHGAVHDVLALRLHAQRAMLALIMAAVLLQSSTIIGLATRSAANE
jgi:hypothetical protein